MDGPKFGQGLGEWMEQVQLTFVLEVLQDGDNGLQWDAVGQEELPGAVLLEGLPVERLDWGGS